MSFFDQASLVMIPSGYKTSKVYSIKPTDGSGDMAFSRSNDTATRVNSAGLIEKVRSNFALRSQSFATSAVWSTAQGTITDNDGIAPDGTNTASKIVATNNDPYAYQSISLSGPVVASCYVKGIGNSIGQNATIVAAQSYLQSFVITGDWQRISVTGTASGSQLYGIEAPNSSVSVGDTVLVWGFQVEYGDVATDYIATTSAAVSVGPVANVPRLDYLNSSCPRLLLEPQRTNLAQYSEQADNGYWGKYQSTITANDTISPDGTQNADRVTLTALDTGVIFKGIAGISAGVQTSSFFAKAGNATVAFMQIYDGTSSFSSKYNLSNGTTTNTSAGATATITSYGNGWYRCTLSATTDGGTHFLDYGVSSTTIGHYGYIWGFQYESLASYATSYIPTLGSASTRGSDSCSKTGISSLIGQTEGTIFAEIYPEEFVNGSYVGISDGSNISNRIIFGFEGGSANSGTLQVYGASGLVGSGTYTRGQQIKIAIAYKSGSSALYVNGSLVDSKTSSFSATFTKFGFDSYAGAQNFIGKCSQVILFPTRLQNSDLAALTA